MSTSILKDWEQARKDYQNKTDNVTNSLRMQVLDDLTKLKTLLKSFPSEIKERVTADPEISELVRFFADAKSHKAQNGMPQRNKRENATADEIVAFCDVPRRNRDINRHFGLTNCSNRLKMLAREGKLKKTVDKRWVRA